MCIKRHIRWDEKDAKIGKQYIFWGSTRNEIKKTHTKKNNNIARIHTLYGLALFSVEYVRVRTYDGFLAHCVHSFSALICSEISVEFNPFLFFFFLHNNRSDTLAEEAEKKTICFCFEFLVFLFFPLFFSDRTKLENARKNNTFRTYNVVVDGKKQLNCEIISFENFIR